MVWVGRDGTQDDPDDADGSGWSVLDGKFIQVAVGSGAVWGLGANREFFYRCGLYNPQHSDSKEKRTSELG